MELTCRNSSGWSALASDCQEGTRTSSVMALLGLLRTAGLEALHGSHTDLEAEGNSHLGAPAAATSPAALASARVPTLPPAGHLPGRFGPGLDVLSGAKLGWAEGGRKAAVCRLSRVTGQGPSCAAHPRSRPLARRPDSKEALLLTRTRELGLRLVQRSSGLGMWVQRGPQTSGARAWEDGQPLDSGARDQRRQALVVPSGFLLHREAEGPRMHRDL